MTTNENLEQAVSVAVTQMLATLSTDGLTTLVHKLQRGGLEATGDAFADEAMTRIERTEI